MTAWAKFIIYYTYKLHLKKVKEFKTVFFLGSRSIPHIAGWVEGTWCQYTPFLFTHFHPPFAAKFWSCGTHQSEEIKRVNISFPGVGNDPVLLRYLTKKKLKKRRGAITLSTVNCKSDGCEFDSHSE